MVPELVTLGTGEADRETLTSTLKHPKGWGPVVRWPGRSPWERKQASFISTRIHQVLSRRNRHSALTPPSLWDLWAGIHLSPCSSPMWISSIRLLMGKSAENVQKLAPSIKRMSSQQSRNSEPTSFISTPKLLISLFPEPYAHFSAEISCEVVKN